MRFKTAALRDSRFGRGDYLFLGIATAIVLLVFGFSVVVWLLISKPAPAHDFCQPTDDVYQYIVAHKDEWLDQFALANGQSNAWLDAYLPSGDKIIVRADNVWRSDDENVAYVSVLSDYPATPKGGGGYLIVPSDDPPERWSADYRLKSMSEQVFCYSKLGRTDF